MKNVSVRLMTGLLFMIITNSGFSQQYILGLDEYIDYANIVKTNAPTSSPYEDIKGSPFLNDDFITGQVKLKNGKIYQGPLRFDIYGNQIEFKTNKGEILSVVNPEQIESVIIRDVCLVYIPEQNSKDKGTFYGEKASGKYSLLTKYNVVYNDPVPAKPYIDPKPASFVRKDNDYFIYNTITGLIQIRNKNSILGILPGKKAEIENFLKKERIKLSDEDGLVRLTEEFNKLTE